jgi:hypothetical protein
VRRLAIYIYERWVDDDFRAGSEVGRVQIAFSSDADQSEQRLPVGVGQRGGFRLIQAFLDEFVLRWNRRRQIGATPLGIGLR